MLQSFQNSFLRVFFFIVGIVCVFLFTIHIPATSASIEVNALIKGPSAAVYYYGQNGKRYVFPNEKTYLTWYGDFSSVKTVSADELASIPIGGNVTYRPGVKLVKITTDPKVYAVGMYGTLRWIKTEAVAISLYGADWNKKVDDIPDAFFVNYTVGAEIGSATEFSPATETSAIQNINMDKKLAGALIYHGVATHSWSNLIAPGGNQTENIKAEVSAYEAAVGRTVAFVEFAHEWKTDGPAFPIAVATSIKNRGATPFIFLNLRSFDIIDEAHQQLVEPLYTLSAILSGKFDSDFAAWADGAKSFGSEIIVDWGWEMNGDWAVWNGAHNGGNIEGPRKFREAYRHIVEIMRKRGANNIQWAFHVNFPEFPSEPWNAFENYYPGDDVIDLIGASIYSAQSPAEEGFPSFESLFDQTYARLVKLAPKKPVYVFEFGAPANHPLGDPAAWADKALADILSGRWPAVRGFAWWNDFWSQDTNPAHDTEMRVEKLPGLAKVFRSRISQASNIGDRAPIFSTPTLTSASSVVSSFWSPKQNSIFQWQLTDSFDPSISADVYDLDLFDTPRETIASLHAKGKKVICYVSVGAWENWRPDKDAFPAAIIGKDYSGWPGEKWLDVRRIDLLGPILQKRFDLAKAKGCDAVEPDNIDGFGADSGFPLTYAHQLVFNRWLAEQTHARGMSIGLKNDPEHARDLLPFFDWALIEDCHVQGWCEDMTPFTSAGKAVFQVEYTDKNKLADFCPAAKKRGFMGILKHRNLDAWIEQCQ